MPIVREAHRSPFGFYLVVHTTHSQNSTETTTPTARFRLIPIRDAQLAVHYILRQMNAPDYKSQQVSIRQTFLHPAVRLTVDAVTASNPATTAGYVIRC